MFKNQISIAYQQMRLTAFWDGKSSYITTGGAKFEFFYEKDEIINNSVFHVIAVVINNNFGKLIYNPISDNYWFCNMVGCPWITPNNIYYPIKCETLNYIGFPIPKNGCSCILKSALYYDTFISNEAAKSEKFIWEDANIYSNVRMKVNSRENFIDNYKNYKKFIVIQPENERFIRFLNWSHKRRYNTYYNFDLSLENSKKEHEWALPLITIDPYCSDQHAITQSVHIKQYIDLFYAGDKKAFDKDVEKVQLKDLPEWFSNTFGKPMITNNIDKPEDWLYKF